MIFIDNKYTKWYNSIIHTALSRISSGYIEKHHIIPECFFKNSNRGETRGNLPGNPDDASNIVNLSAKEHFICHLLLPKMVTGNKKRQMIFALWSMSHRHHTSDENIYKCNSRIYKSIKEKFSVQMSLLHTGKILTQVTRDKISRAHAGKVLSDEHKRKINPKGRKLSEDAKANISKGQLGRVGGMTGKSHSKEARKKISTGNRGKAMPSMSEERKCKISKQFLGTIQSEEHKYKRIKSRQKNGHFRDPEKTKKKMSESAKNRPKIQCHCGKKCSATNFKRWHGENCKYPKS